MAKASDILKRTGAVGGPPSQPDKSIKIAPAKEGDSKSAIESAAAARPDLGHNLHKGGKAQGGGGQSSARPKV